MRKFFRLLLLIPAATLALLAGSSAMAGGLVELEFNPDHFPGSPQVDNPYWPLTPGHYFIYFAETDDGCEWNVVDVTYVEETVEAGVTGVQVQDMEWLDETEGCSESDFDASDYNPPSMDFGTLAAEDMSEFTWDWYAQDMDHNGYIGGNIWYLGEATWEFDYEEGECETEESVSPTGEVGCEDGSFEAGADGTYEGTAEAGLIMLADPQKGDFYQQELDIDNAEDWAKVLNFVPVEDEEDCLKAKEWSPLERGAIEHKYYCPDVDDEGSLLLIEEVSGGMKVFVELIDVGTY